jgi:hypothetical protein
VSLSGKEGASEALGGGFTTCFVTNPTKGPTSHKHTHTRSTPPRVFHLHPNAIL